jgi:flagellar biosynthesis protein FlhG
MQRAMSTNRAPCVTAIASGKGGVGKTWFSITLAHALARDGARVLVLDGDFGLANIDIQLGLTPPHDLGGVIAGRVSLAQAAHAVPDGGFEVLAGRSGSGALAALPPETLRWLLTGLATLPHDHVLIDLGAGLEAPVRLLAARADQLLVLATDEPTSLTDAYAVLKLHAADRPAGPARIIVNQASSVASGQRTYATLARACARFLGHAPPLAGVIRKDSQVREAIRRQTLLLNRHPLSPAGADVCAIAATLRASPADTTKLPRSA